MSKKTPDNGACGLSPLQWIAEFKVRRDEMMEIANFDPFAVAKKEAVDRLLQGIKSRTARRLEMGMPSSQTKKMFREKLQRVRGYVEKQGNENPCVGFEALEMHSPQHHERVVITEAYKQYYGVDVARFTESQWQSVNIDYVAVGKYSLAIITTKTGRRHHGPMTYVGVGKRWTGDKPDWELGCMLAVFRAALAMWRDCATL